MSAASSAGDWYRRARSFSRHFITSQSNSPRTSRPSRRASTPRRSATVVICLAARVLTRRLGRAGSSSRMIRRISSNPAFRSASGSNGVVPVSSSYRRTPSEYTSARVSMSTPLSSACSGAMYSGVPTIWKWPVCSVRSVSAPPVALAMPKSITFGTGRPSTTVTRTLDGLMSRWMTPFMCACWTARQMSANRASRSGMVSRARSQ